MIVKLLCVFLSVGSGCSGLRTERYVPETSIPAKPGKPARFGTGCTNWVGYVPDARHPEYQRMRYLRINFHVVNSRDSSKNYRPAEGRIFFRELLAAANAALDTNVRNWRSPDGTAVLPKGYRYQLTPQPGDDGFYFHYDDSLYWFVSSGQYQNNYSRQVIEQYNVGKDSILNVFLLVHPVDSLLSKTYHANGQGIALGTALKMGVVFNPQAHPVDYVGLFNHEIGHLLGLSHAWTEDGCPDTQNHPNRCWLWSEEEPCRSQASNNMMDYNAYQIALTPAQIGHTQAVLATEKNPARRCLSSTWCHRNPQHDLVIRDSVAWSGARDLEGNLTIAPGGALRLSCRLSMPAGSRITIQPGGHLWLDGARLHNACGLEWQGVFIEKKGAQRGRVYALQPLVLENCPLLNPQK